MITEEIKNINTRTNRLALPCFLKTAYKIWMGLAAVIGWFMTRVILTIFFYFIVTPIGLLMRLFGKSVLDMKFHSNTASYWISRKELNPDKRNYEKQF